MGFTVPARNAKMKRLADWKKTKEAKTKADVEKVESQQSGDTVSVNAALISERVVTREDLLKKLSLDPAIWTEVELSLIHI